MGNQWENGCLTIVGIPNQQLYDSLIPIIREWTTERILGQFMIFGPSDYVAQNRRPPKVKVSVFGLNDQNEVETIELDLFAILASQEWQKVRMLSIQTATERWDDEGGNWDFLNDVADHISSVLPLAGMNSRAIGQGTLFTKLNLLVAQTYLNDVERSALINSNWDFNIIASPEDRSTPWSPDAMIEDGKRFLLFVLMHAASVGAFWDGLSESPYDEIGREGGITGRLYMSRVFVSAIITDSLARRVAAQTLKTIGSAPEDLFNARLGVAIPGTQLIPPGDEDAYKEWMIGQILALDDGYLTFKRSDEFSEPLKLRWFELEQIVHFLKFCFDKIYSVPRWNWIAFRRKLGRRMTKEFHGQDGVAYVGIDQNDALDRRDKILLRVLEQVYKDESEAKSSLAASSVRNDGQRVVASSKVWSGIRRIIFGLLDGSSLEEYGISTENGPLPVFAGVRSVMQDPTDNWSPPQIFEEDAAVKSLKWNQTESFPLIYESLLTKQDEETIKLEELKARKNELEVEISKLDGDA